MGVLKKCPFCGEEVDTSYPHFLWVEANQGFSLSHTCCDGDEHIASITIFGKTAEEVFQRWNDRIGERMILMLNHITIMGRLTKDVELRRTSTGTAVASFTIACDRDFGDKETDFIEVTAWKNTAEFAAKYFSKGRMAVVSGRLQIRSWTDKDGNKRKTAEVVADNLYFGDSKKDVSDNPVGDISCATPFQGDFPTLTEPDEGLPF